MDIRVNSYLAKLENQPLQNIKNQLKCANPQTISGTIEAIYRKAISDTKREFHGLFRIFNPFIAVVYWLKNRAETRKWESNKENYSKEIVTKVNDEFQKRIKKLEIALFPDFKTASVSTGITKFRQALQKAIEASSLEEEDLKGMVKRTAVYYYNTICLPTDPKIDFNGDAAQTVVQVSRYIRFQEVREQVPFLKEQEGSDTVTLFRKDLTDALYQFCLANTAETPPATYVEHLKERALAVYRDLHGRDAIQDQTAVEVLAAVKAWIIHSEKQEAIQDNQDKLAALTPQIEQAKRAIQDTQQKLKKEQAELVIFDEVLSKKKKDLNQEQSKKRDLLGSYITTITNLNHSLSETFNKNKFFGSLLAPAKVASYVGETSLVELEKAYQALDFSKIKSALTGTLNDKLRKEFPQYQQAVKGELTAISDLIDVLEEVIKKTVENKSNKNAEILKFQTALTGQQAVLKTLEDTQTTLQTELTALTAPPVELPVQPREPALAPAPVIIEKPAEKIQDLVIAPTVPPPVAPPSINYFETGKIAAVKDQITTLFNLLTNTEKNVVITPKSAWAMMGSLKALRNLEPEMNRIRSLQYALALLSDPMLVKKFAVCVQKLPTVMSTNAAQVMLKEHVQRISDYFTGDQYNQDELRAFEVELAKLFEFNSDEFTELVGKIQIQGQSIDDRMKASKDLLLWMVNKRGAGLPLTI